VVLALSMSLLLASSCRGGSKFFRPFAVFDFLVLFAGVVLPWGIDKAGIHDTAFSGDDAFASERGVEGFEEFAAAIASVGFDEFFEIPNGGGVGDFISGAQVEKGEEAEAISDFLLGAFVTQAVEFLEDEDLKHEDGIEWRAPPFAPILGGVSGDFFEHGPEALPVNEIAQLADADFSLRDLLLMSEGRKEIPTAIELAILLYAKVSQA
jgi:hypothetical protein